MRKLLQFPCRHDECHSVEALLKLILRGISLVIDEIVIVIIFVLAFFVDLGDYRQLVRVLEIEQQLDGSATPSHVHWLAADNGREGRQALLAIQ